MAAWRHDWQRIDRDDDPEAEVLLAPFYMLGAKFHLWAVRVVERGGLQLAVCDPYARLDDLRNADDGADGFYETVTLDGFPGRWVVWATPYAGA